MKNRICCMLLTVISCFAGLHAQTKKWTLQECVQYALENNISIKQTDLDNRLAEIDKLGAIGNYIPTVNANASHSWNNGLNQNITTGLLENQTTQFTAAGANVSVSLYNGLQNLNRLRRANLSIISAQYQLSKMKDDVSLNVANAFLQILFNKENLKVQQEQLANNKRQEERSAQLVEAGSIPRGDLLDMKATVATSNQTVINAENNLLLSKLSLAQLLQFEDFANFDVADEGYDIVLSPTMNESADAILAKAKEMRVELKIAKTNLEIAEKDIQIARGAFQPSLQGFYSFSTRAAYSDRIVGFDDNNNPILQSALPVFDQFDENKGHSYGLQLNIPILNGFSTRNALERTKVALVRSEIDYEREELDLERNVYTAFADAKGALNAYESATIAAEAREEAFKYASERYAVGMMNSFDFNQAQTLFTNSQSEVIRTKFDYIFKVKVLEFYFGIPITQN